MINEIADLFGDQLLPQRGSRRATSTESPLPLAEWLKLPENTPSILNGATSGPTRLPKVMFSCAWCGETHIRTARLMRQILKRTSTAPCCSKTCAAFLANSKRPKIQVRGCEVCGKEFRPRNNIQPGRYCSRTCKDRGHSAQIAGKNNPGYRHGKSPEREKRSVQKAFFDLKAPVMYRDKFRCVVCRSGERLQVHHINIDPFDNRMENLVTLCQRCHRQWHAAERSASRAILWPWLSEYASQSQSMISR